MRRLYTVVDEWRVLLICLSVWLLFCFLIGGFGFAFGGGAVGATDEQVCFWGFFLALIIGLPSDWLRRRCAATRTSSAALAPGASVAFTVSAKHYSRLVTLAENEGVHANDYAKALVERTLG